MQWTHDRAPLSFLVALLVVFGLPMTGALAGANGTDNGTDTTAAKMETVTETKAVPETQAAPASEKAAAPAKKSAKGGSTENTVTIETNMGTIQLKLFPDVAPKAVENFKGLAAKGYYNGIIFHRVIDGFMIQGGDPTGTGRGGESFWGKPFADEFSPKYRFTKKGILAMANAGPMTNGSQFFITLAPTPHLNDRHTIFGEVISGMDVVEKIGKVKKGPGDKPLEPVKMIKVTVGGTKAESKPPASK